MNKAAAIVAFIAGAAIGSVATWQYTKKKYERLAQEEINSVKEVFSKKNEVQSESEDKGEPEPAEDTSRTRHFPNVMEYAAQLREQGYTNASPEDTETTEKLDRKMYADPYVISPEEFDEHEDYETISLTYYADQVLADDNDQVIRNVDDLVGYESLTHFGEYEDDSVFVRNDRLKCDFEILLDQRRYAEVLDKNPYKADE